MGAAVARGEERVRLAETLRREYEGPERPGIGPLANKHGLAYDTARHLLLEAGTELRKPGGRRRDYCHACGGLRSREQDPAFPSQPEPVEVPSDGLEGQALRDHWAGVLAAVVKGEADPVVVLQEIVATIEAERAETSHQSDLADYYFALAEKQRGPVTGGG